MRIVRKNRGEVERWNLEIKPDLKKLIRMKAIERDMTTSRYLELVIQTGMKALGDL